MKQRIGASFRRATEHRVSVDYLSLASASHGISGFFAVLRGLRAGRKSMCARRRRRRGAASVRLCEIRMARDY